VIFVDLLAEILILMPIRNKVLPHKRDLCIHGWAQFVAYALRVSVRHRLERSMNNNIYISGRLYQVEYAMEAIGHAGTCLGILSDDGILLAAERRVTNKLLDEVSYSEKIYRLHEYVSLAQLMAMLSMGKVIPWRTPIWRLCSLLCVIVFSWLLKFL